MNTKTNTEYRIVYVMKIAMDLIARGHIVLSTMPNPHKTMLTMWVFKQDDTLDADIEALKEDRRNER